MRSLRLTILAGMALVWAAVPAGGQLLDDVLVPGAKRPSALDEFSARVVLSHKTVRPGDSLHVAVEMTVAEKFWVYGPVAGGKIVAAQDLTVAAGATRLKVGEVLFSLAHPHVTKFPDGSSDTHNVYEGRGYAYVPVTVPAGLAPGRYELPLQIAGQLCDPSVCMQLAVTITAAVEVGDETLVSPEWAGEIKDGLARARTTRQWREALTTAPMETQAAPPARRVDFAVFGGTGLADMSLAGGLALAFLAGLILNVMPCVLPVIPLRLLALLNQAKQRRRRFISLGMAFALGIMLFFVGIAAASAALKLALGYILTLSDLFRHPPLVIAMVLLLVAMAANMFDVFTLTVPGRVGEAEPGQGHLGAVGMGFLMGILSTPCSGAVLAAAFAWAQLKPLWIGTLSLVVMGVGMAAPHVVLAFFPQVVSRLPRAGRWTGLFKEFVGFVLLLIAVWLLGTQISEVYLRWVLAYAVVVAMCLWMWGRWVSYDAAAWRKWSVRLSAAAVAVGCGLWMLRPPAPPVLEMRPFDAAEIAAARAADRTVLVKFTAAWCVECKVVDVRVYDKAEVAETLRRRGVLAVKGDVTKDRMPASRMLYDQLGQSGPPLTVIFPPKARPPILLRGAFSTDDLFQALDMAQGGGAARP